MTRRCYNNVISFAIVVIGAMERFSRDFTRQGHEDHWRRWILGVWIGLDASCSQSRFNLSAVYSLRHLLSEHEQEELSLVVVCVVVGNALSVWWAVLSSSFSSFALVPIGSSVLYQVLFLYST